MDKIISLKSLSSQSILEIIKEFHLINTDAGGDTLFFKNNSELFRTKIMSTLFISESLRTRASFISSFLRLGGSHLSFDEHERAIEESTNTESIEDISGFISQYCDVIVTRTNCEHSFKRIISGAQVPVISAGHGEIEHPVTAINYLADIYCTLGRLNNLNILVIAKQPKRCVNSLIIGLKKWPNNKIIEYNLDQKIHIKLSNEYMKSFDIIFFDESKNDYLNGFNPDFCLSLKSYNIISESTHIIHAKPVLKLFKEDLKKHISKKLLNQSKNSTLIKSIIYKKLIDV